jgi:hypothetical protein
VAHAIQQKSPPGAPRRRLILLISAVLMAVMGSSMALISWHTSRLETVRQAAPSSPYENTRTEVKYVGDATCVRCHVDIAETYRQHPMGRSLSPVGAAPSTGSNEASNRPLFEAQGLEYSIAHREGRVIHHETRRNSSGHIIARNEAEVQFVIGSGRQGLAYLIERDGFLFQSPISWYAQKQRWDLSTPGMKGRTPTSTGRLCRPACSAMQTGSNGWRARLTVISRRSSTAMPSAASGVMGPVNSMSHVQQWPPVGI